MKIQRQGKDKTETRQDRSPARRRQEMKASQGKKLLPFNRVAKGRFGRAAQPSLKRGERGIDGVRVRVRVRVRVGG